MMLLILVAAFSMAGPVTDPDGGTLVERVGGDLEIRLETREGPEGPLYRSGRSSTDTKLPVGSPAPTPPGGACPR